MARSFRHTFILGMVAAASALAAVGGWRYARASAPVSGPIVLISVDSLRADRLPVYGYTRAATPAIDALAADGIVFERAYSHVPQTLPAHVSMLSGRLPPQTGVRDNVGFAVGEAERMLAEMLRDRGYKTAAIVSSFVLRADTGINRGFEFFDDTMGRDGLERSGHASERIAEEWLASTGDSRVFVLLHLYEPHAPYTPPSAFVGRGDPYDGEIAVVDDIVGRLVRYLKSHQLYDQSTIVLASDHGEGLGDHGEQTHGLLVYEEALHVPLIIKPAAGIGAGRRVKSLVQHVDLVPMILDLANAPIPDNLPGESLRPLFEGEEWSSNRIVYSESLYGWYRFGWSMLTSVTDGRFRYVQAPTEVLYDLERAEPRENLARQRPDRAAVLRSSLADHRATFDTSSVEPPTRMPLPELEHFEALGYVGEPRPTVEDAADPQRNPKDSVRIVNDYRAAIRDYYDGQWTTALERLREVAEAEPQLPGIWRRLARMALRLGRYDRAVEWARRAAMSSPSDPGPHLAAAEALLQQRQLDAATTHGEAAAAVALDDSAARGAAHELLARIAVQRRDANAARNHAALAAAAEPERPVLAFVEGRILYDRGHYQEALSAFESARASSGGSAAPILDLHFYAAEALVRLDRPGDAEPRYRAELERFPHNLRAASALASLYHRQGRLDEAGRVLDDLVRTTPTIDAYNLVVRLWTAFGDHQRAAALRAESRRVLDVRPTVDSAH